MLPKTFKNKKIAIFGLGIEGIDLVKYLSEEKAIITIFDQKEKIKLNKAFTEIKKYKINAFHKEIDNVNFKNFDWAFISQGIPLNSTYLDPVYSNKIPLSSMTDLFFNRCISPIVGISGSSGKTTTTSMVDSILKESNANYSIGGNIGIGLLGLINKINSDTKVITELSHSQLQLLSKNPSISCITNITPNHLDNFSWEEYVSLKKRITIFQNKDDNLILNKEDTVSKQFINETKAQISYFSIKNKVEKGAYLDKNGFLCSVNDNTEIQIMHVDEIKVRGEHNIYNALAAISITRLLNIDAISCRQGIIQFQGVDHRIETILIKNNIEFINDSIATTPERTNTGLKSLNKDVILLLGGRDKNLEFGDLIATIQKKCKAVIVFGESRKKFIQELTNKKITIYEEPTLETATILACRIAITGDCVFLSPGATSFDEFENFSQRGDKFKHYVANFFQISNKG